MSTKKKIHIKRLEEHQKKLAANAGISHQEAIERLDKFVDTVSGICDKMARVFYEESEESGLKNCIIAAQSAPLTFLMHIITKVHTKSGIEPYIVYPDLFDAYERILRLVVMLKPAYTELPWQDFQELVKRRYKDMGNDFMEVERE